MPYASRYGPGLSIYPAPNPEHLHTTCPKCRARPGARCKPRPPGGTHAARLRAAGIDTATVEGTAAYGRAVNARAAAVQRQWEAEGTVEVIEQVGGWDAWQALNADAAPAWIAAWREHWESPEALAIRTGDPQPDPVIMAQIEAAGSWSAWFFDRTRAEDPEPPPSQLGAEAFK
ncbi:hypothetical protein ACGF0K_01040 [Streptomyces sp. NPDC048156]|uniref:hypothetical protein n=1 Tax=Streptomyces sp. NPDC048156 TaxID=3365502 RepID=UPI003722C8FB